MKPIKPFLLSILLLICVSCTKLAPGGAYNPTTTNTVTHAVTSAPDDVLFTIDKTFKIAQATIESVFAAEKEHRAYFWAIDPNIKRELDKLRDRAWEVEVKFAKARAAYKTRKTPAGLSELQNLLVQLTNLSISIESTFNTRKD